MCYSPIPERPSNGNWFFLAYKTPGSTALHLHSPYRNSSCKRCTVTRAFEHRYEMATRTKRSTTEAKSAQKQAVLAARLTHALTATPHAGGRPSGTSHVTPTSGKSLSLGTRDMARTSGSVSKGRMQNIRHLQTWAAELAPFVPDLDKCSKILQDASPEEKVKLKRYLTQLRRKLTPQVQRPNVIGFSVPKYSQQLVQVE